MAKPGFVWSGTEWENFTGPSPETLPAGTIAMWVKATPPSGWFICDGAEYNKTTYAELFNNVGDVYELGTETLGNSRLPDMRARFVIGSENPYKVLKQKAYEFNSSSGSGIHQHTFVSTISLATGNTAHNHTLATTNHDHTHNTNAPTTNNDGAHNHPMNAHNPNAEANNIGRTAGGPTASFPAHSHTANAPSTNGGGEHNHGLNGVSTSAANVPSHGHQTNYSSLNTHNHTVLNSPVLSGSSSSGAHHTPPYLNIFYIIKRTND